MSHLCLGAEFDRGEDPHAVVLEHLPVEVPSVLVLTEVAVDLTSAVLGGNLPRHEAQHLHHLLDQVGVVVSDRRHRIDVLLRDHHDLHRRELRLGVVERPDARCLMDGLHE